MIAKYADLSTAHLRVDTIENLDADTIPYSYEYEEGIFISVPEEMDLEDDEWTKDFPDDLLNLLEYAWKNECQLIRLDRDAEIIKELPVYQRPYDKNIQAIEEIRRLEKRIPQEVAFRDSDTILADYTTLDPGNENTGVAEDLFQLYENNSDNSIICDLFFLFTGIPFSDYLDECIEVLREQEKNFINK